MSIEDDITEITPEVIEDIKRLTGRDFDSLSSFGKLVVYLTYRNKIKRASDPAPISETIQSTVARAISVLEKWIELMEYDYADSKTPEEFANIPMVISAIERLSALRDIQNCAHEFLVEEHLYTPRCGKCGCMFSNDFEHVITKNDL